MSKKSIQDLANQLAADIPTVNSSILLEKVRILYEQITLLHHVDIPETDITEAEVAIDKEQPIEETLAEEITKTTEQELTVQERIQKIMETAPAFESDTKPQTPTTTESFEKEVSPETYQDENKADNDTETSQKVNIDEEFKDAISADYAADLFESAEKIEITKKSLNDTLSQKQLQIGLNDRIAFVKHLFNGSQADFNRVLSQLNSFQNEAQAKNFVNTVVKPDFNWSDKVEYEERFISLIERKFL